MVFYLNVTVETAIERIKSRNDNMDFFETFESLLKVKSNYEKLISDELGLGGVWKINIVQIYNLYRYDNIEKLSYFKSFYAKTSLDIEWFFDRSLHF